MKEGEDSLCIDNGVVHILHAEGAHVFGDFSVKDDVGTDVLRMCGEIEGFSDCFLVLAACGELDGHAVVIIGFTDGIGEDNVGLNVTRREGGTGDVVGGDETYDETAYMAVGITDGTAEFEVLRNDVQNIVDRIGCFFGGTVIFHVANEVIDGKRLGVFWTCDKVFGGSDGNRDSVLPCIG